jgi:hypothetical protein
MAIRQRKTVSNYARRGRREGLPLLYYTVVEGKAESQEISAERTGFVKPITPMPGLREAAPV